MSETTERATGATDEQIEAALVRYKDFLCTVGYEPSVDELGNMRGMVEAHAEYLVPPGYRIVPADVVLSDNNKDLVREAFDEFVDRHETVPVSGNLSRHVRSIYEKLGIERKGG